MKTKKKKTGPRDLVLVVEHLSSTLKTLDSIPRTTNVCVCKVQVMLQGKCITPIDHLYQKRYFKSIILPEKVEKRETNNKKNRGLGKKLMELKENNEIKRLALLQNSKLLNFSMTDKNRKREDNAPIS